VPLILQYLPVGATRLVEPFCGSVAMCSERGAAVPGCGFGRRPRRASLKLAARRRHNPQARRLRYDLSMTVPQSLKGK
jgi:hypothetical protein